MATTQFVERVPQSRSNVEKNEPNLCYAVADLHLQQTGYVNRACPLNPRTFLFQIQQISKFSIIVFVKQKFAYRSVLAYERLT